MLKENQIKVIQNNIDKLKEFEKVAFVLDEILYTVFRRDDGDYEINTYDPFELSDSDVEDGGIYKGTAKDAINFAVE